MDDAGAYASQYLSALSLPAFLLQPDGVVIWSNKAAAELLESEGGVHLRNGRLGFLDKPFTTRLYQATAHESDVVTLAAPNPLTGGHLVAQLTPLRPDGRGHATLLTLKDTASQSTQRWADIDTIFGLTPAEGRIARQLADHRSVREIADHLDISIETVRTHIRRLHSKLGVSSREALCEKIQPFRA